MENAPNQAYQFSEFLQEILDQREIVPSSFNWMAGQSMPQPYRDLLVHQGDMTTTLEKYHQSPVALEVLQVTHEEGDYVREVILNKQTTGEPIEYGAIDIVLNHFPSREKDAIVSGKEPLGGIMNRMDHPYFSRPVGYFSLPAPSICQERFSCSPNTTLYGRHNKLVNEDDETLASIIEILPSI